MHENLVGSFGNEDMQEDHIKWLTKKGVEEMFLKVLGVSGEF